MELRAIVGEDVLWASRLTPVGDEAEGTGRRGRRPEDVGAGRVVEPLTKTDQWDGGGWLRAFPCRFFLP